MGKLTISMAIFNSYVKLPEGIQSGGTEVGTRSPRSPWSPNQESWDGRAGWSSRFPTKETIGGLVDGQLKLNSFLCLGIHGCPRLAINSFVWPEIELCSLWTAHDCKCLFCCFLCVSQMPQGPSRCQGKPLESTRARASIIKFYAGVNGHLVSHPCSRQSILRWMVAKSYTVDRWFIPLFADIFVGFQASFWWCRISSIHSRYLHLGVYYFSWCLRNLKCTRSRKKCSGQTHQRPKSDSETAKKTGMEYSYIYTI